MHLSFSIWSHSFIRTGCSVQRLNKFWESNDEICASVKYIIPFVKSSQGSKNQANISDLSHAGTFSIVFYWKIEIGPGKEENCYHNLVNALLFSNANSVLLCEFSAIGGLVIMLSFYLHKLPLLGTVSQFEINRPFLVVSDFSFREYRFANTKPQVCVHSWNEHHLVRDP